MRELMLMRHAHAENEHAPGGDAGRHLDARGVAEASAAAQRLQALGWIPDTIVASSAVRTRETARIVAELLGFDEQHIAFEPRLYHSPAEIILETIRCCRPQAQRLLLVGHNPGLSQLAQQFCGQECRGLPTAALCLITPGAASWLQLKPRAGTGRVLQ